MRGEVARREEAALAVGRVRRGRDRFYADERARGGRRHAEVQV